MDNLAPYDFFFELPLYTKIEVPFTNTTPLRGLLNFRGTIDAYNPELKENTTYRITNNSYSNSNQVDSYNGYTSYTATCVRNNYAIRFFIFLNQTENGDWVIQKVGQHPSIADLHISKVRAYDKVLSKQKITEFTKAIGLAANGVGIGSFVYLRRIFEGLIDEALQDANQKGSFDNDSFRNSRMAEKIEMLNDFLPAFLVENKTLYSILSLGIHELNEQDCLKHFEVVKLGIETILDEKVESYERNKRIEEARKKIQLATQQLSKK